MFDYCKICESLNTFAATNVAYRVTFKMEILNICKYVNTETKDILSEREENIVKKKKKKSIHRAMTLKQMLSLRMKFNLCF